MAAAGQWRALVDAAEGELRLTPWRGVVLPGAPAGRLPALTAAGFRTGAGAAVGTASGAVAGTAAGAAWDGASACTGLPGCAKSRSDVRADAARALDEAPVPDETRALDKARALDGTRVPNEGAALLPVHWSGCERRCGHPAGRRVDVLATGESYRVAVTGGPQGRDTAVEVTNEQMAAAVAAARRTT